MYPGQAYKASKKDKMHKGGKHDKHNAGMMMQQHAMMPAGPNDSIRFQAKGKGLKGMDLLTGKSDPYMEFYRSEGNQWVKAFQTQVCYNTVKPSWNTITIPLMTLCQGDTNRPVLIKCLDFDQGAAPDLIGTVQFYPRDLVGGGKLKLALQGSMSMTSMFNAKKMKKHMKYGCGMIVLSDGQILRQGGNMQGQQMYQQPMQGGMMQGQPQMMQMQQPHMMQPTMQAPMYSQPQASVYTQNQLVHPQYQQQPQQVQQQQPVQQPQFYQQQPMVATAQAPVYAQPQLQPQGMHYQQQQQQPYVPQGQQHAPAPPMYNNQNIAPQQPHYQPQQQMQMPPQASAPGPVYQQNNPVQMVQQASPPVFKGAVSSAPTAKMPPYAPAAASSAPASTPSYVPAAASSAPASAPSLYPNMRA